MCDHENREDAMIALRRSAAGSPTVWCDPCIAPVVRALNDGGVPTITSCCGHGKNDSSILLGDGRWLTIVAEPPVAYEFRPERGEHHDAEEREAENPDDSQHPTIGLARVIAAWGQGRGTTRHIPQWAVGLATHLIDTGYAQAKSEDHAATVTVDRENLAAEASFHTPVALCICETIGHPDNHPDCGNQEKVCEHCDKAWPCLGVRAVASLTAPGEVDEEKLMEVVIGALITDAVIDCWPLGEIKELAGAVAHAVAELLRAEGRRASLTGCSVQNH